MHVKNDAEGLPKNVPQSYRHRGHFWYTSQLLAFMLTRTNEHFQREVDRAKKVPHPSCQLTAST